MDFLLTVYRIAQAALGVGLVIFVHEAGHYFAARLCGVRVEVFSLGFGPRIWGRQIGSTLYQIALVPFGGYVRMAGDDFTGNADRTRDPLPDELMGKRPLQRFFIYSGGVVMNVVFAIVVFPLALLAGVPSLMPVIGEPSTGSPLWLAHLEPGTRIEEVNGVEVFDVNHIENEIAMGGSQPARLLIRRPGKDSVPETLTITPKYSEQDGLFRIGVRPGIDPSHRLIVEEASPAFEGGMRSGDVLLEVVGSPPGLSLERQLDAAFYAGAGVALRVERDGQPLEFSFEPRDSPQEQVLIGLQPGSLRLHGLRSSELTENLELLPGDSLRRIGDRNVYTPYDVLPALLALSGELRMEVLRGDRPRTIVGPALSVSQAVALESDLDLRSDTEGRLIAVLPGTAAEEAGLLSGDEILTLNGKEVATYEDFLEATKGARRSPRPIELEVRRTDLDGQAQVLTVNVTPRNAPRRYYGFDLDMARYVYQVHSVPAAVTAGLSASWRFAQQVMLTLRKMTSGEVSSRNLGGPITIGLFSHHFAMGGWAKLFFFLCILSINLALINVLPIPVLDGGHLFFILVEMIKGSPVSERTLGYSQIVGLVLIVSLMVYVTYNDVMRFFM
jgi:regulator of sigma E protease